MLFFIIVATVLIIVSITFESYIDFSELLLPVIFLSVMVSFGVSVIVYSSSEIETVETDFVEIYSLQDHLTGDGSFFLGTGSTDGDIKYYYYYESDFGLKYDSVSAASVSIVFDYEPRLITYKEQFKNRALANWFFEFGSTKKVLYIPENTVFENICIDLK